jgi:hypothetical protein
MKCSFSPASPLWNLFDTSLPPRIPGSKEEVSGRQRGEPGEAKRRHRGNIFQKFGPYTEFPANGTRYLIQLPVRGPTRWTRNKEGHFSYFGSLTGLVKAPRALLFFL